MREARIHLAAGLVSIDGLPGPRIGESVPWTEVRHDVALLDPYFADFGQFYGDAAGVQRSYWALTCGSIRSLCIDAARGSLRHNGLPLSYPVYAVIYGRSDGGKTMFSRVISRSMFGTDQMVRGQLFTAKRARGLRDQLGAIPLLIDDVDRTRFTEHVPELVKHDHESSESYAPILVSTNRDVTVIPPDLRKRMVVCHINGARPRSIAAAPAHQAPARIGTALYRTYLDRLGPRIPIMLEDVMKNPMNPPDLLQASADILGDLVAEALDGRPSWAAGLRLEEVDRLKDKPFLDHLQGLLDRDDESVRIDRKAGEMLVNFAGDHHQASRFERSVPAQALKGRFTDTIKLDLLALEQEYGFVTTRPTRSWWDRLRGR